MEEMAVAMIIMAAKLAIVVYFGLYFIQGLVNALLPPIARPLDWAASIGKGVSEGLIGFNIFK